MKASNIFLISLLTATLLFLIGSNLVLKAEFDKIDQNDPYTGFRKQAVQPFKYISLEGKTFNVTQIEQGEKFEIRTTSTEEELPWKISGDTLKITYSGAGNQNGYPYNDPFAAATIVFITAPSLQGISSNGISCILTGWNLEKFSIHQQGNAALLINNTIKNLVVSLKNEGYLKIDQHNNIEYGEMKLEQKSRFDTENVFEKYSLEADSSSHVTMPGTMLSSAVKAK